MNPLDYTPAQLKKVGVFLVTGLSQAVTLGLFDGTTEKIILSLITAAGAFGIFAARNAPA